MLGGSGGVHVEEHIHNYGGQEVQTNTRDVGDGRIIREIIIGTVNEDISNRGPISRNMAGAFGLKRGNIGPAIPALRVPLIDTQSIPNATRTIITQWGGGFDQFGIRSGVDFTLPAWAAYARITCSVVSWDLSAGNYLHLQLSRNGSPVASGAGRGMDTSQLPTAYADTGIMGVSGGDVFSAHVMHNYGSSRNMTNTGGTMFNIELFEAI